MRRILIVPLAVAALFPASALASAADEGGPSAAGVRGVVLGNTRFALDLYGRLAEDGNVFFSPYSVSTALAMTYAGARGQTEGEMARVLGFPPRDQSDEIAEADARAAVRREVAAAFAALEEGLSADPESRGYSLRVANALWGAVDYPFLESYVEFVGDHFAAPLSLVDFARDTEAARVEINGWVEKRTRERIKDLIPRGVLVPETLLVLTNAIYFKGSWEAEFDPRATREAEFHGLGGSAGVQMMSRKGDYGYCENDEAQILEMPYQGGDLSMLVLLPKIEGVVGLEALERALTAENLEAWSGAIRKREVAVSFPRFQMTWGTKELRGALRALGMKSAFDPGRADFSGMSSAGGLFVGPVLHKAFIEVNEEGTEAAAATAVGMLGASLPLVFRADRPFVFTIRDTRTGSVLFLGRVTDLGE